MLNLDRMSPRQKAAAALSVIGLKDEDLQPLDEVVANVFGNPLVGAMTGIDFSTVRELVEGAFAVAGTDADNAQWFKTFRISLSNEAFRAGLAGGIVKVISQLEPSKRTAIASVIGKLSELPIPEFEREFENEVDFLSNGLLTFLARPSDDPEMFACPSCGVCSFV